MSTDDRRNRNDDHDHDNDHDHDEKTVITPLTPELVAELTSSGEVTDADRTVIAPSRFGAKVEDDSLLDDAFDARTVVHASPLPPETNPGHLPPRAVRMRAPDIQAPKVTKDPTGSESSAPKNLPPGAPMPPPTRRTRSANIFRADELENSVVTEMPKELRKDLPKEAAKPVVIESAKDLPTDLPKAVVRDVAKEPTKEAVKAVKEVAKEVPKESAKSSTKELVKEIFKDSPVKLVPPVELVKPPVAAEPVKAAKLEVPEMPPVLPKIEKAEGSLRATRSQERSGSPFSREDVALPPSLFPDESTKIQAIDEHDDEITLTDEAIEIPEVKPEPVKVAAPKMAAPKEAEPFPPAYYTPPPPPERYPESPAMHQALPISEPISPTSSAIEDQLISPAFDGSGTRGDGLYPSERRVPKSVMVGAGLALVAAFIFWIANKPANSTEQSSHAPAKAVAEIDRKPDDPKVTPPPQEIAAPQLNAVISRFSKAFTTAQAQAEGK